MKVRLKRQRDELLYVLKGLCQWWSGLQPTTRSKMRPVKWRRAMAVIKRIEMDIEREKDA